VTAIPINAPGAYVVRTHTVTFVALAGLVYGDFDEVYVFILGGFLKIGCDSDGEFYIRNSTEDSIETIEPVVLSRHDLEVNCCFGLGDNSGLIVQRIVIVNPNRRLTALEQRRASGLGPITPVTWADFIGDE